MVRLTHRARQVVDVIYSMVILAFFASGLLLIALLIVAVLLGGA